MAPDVNAWLDAGAKGTGTTGGRVLVARENFTDPNGVPLVLQLTVKKITTANWSYTFYLETKEGADPFVERGSWVMDKTNSKGARRTLLIQQIEAAWDIEAERLGLVDRSAPVATTTLISTETSEGLTYTIEEVENAFGSTGTIWLLKIDGFSDRSVAPREFDSLAAAQAEQQRLQDYYNTDYAEQDQYTHNDVVITVNRLYENDRNTATPYETNYGLMGNDNSTFQPEYYTVGDEITYKDQSFGTLTGNVSTDLEILYAYIDAKTAPVDVDPGDFGDYTGPFTVLSWGWYANEENRNDDRNPFSEFYFGNVYTVSNTDGRILQLVDDDMIAGGYESGYIKFTVKPDYRVKLKLMSQNAAYFRDNIPNVEDLSIEFEALDAGDVLVFQPELDYANTEKMTINLYGGDSVEVDVDNITNDPKVKPFSIVMNGNQIVRGAPTKVNDEFFMAIIEVEKLAPGESPESGNSPSPGLPSSGGDQSSTEDDNGKTSMIGGLLIVAAVGFILFLLLRSNAGGGEE